MRMWPYPRHFTVQAKFMPETEGSAYRGMSWNIITGFFCTFLTEVLACKIRIFEFQSVYNENREQLVDP